MTTEIEGRLEQEAQFGDLVEITLKRDQSYCAVHSNGEVIILPKIDRIKFQEWWVYHVSGYYGGMRVGDLQEATAATTRGVIPVLISRPGENYVHLNPTVHDEHEVHTIQCKGSGIVRIPISAIASYEIMSTKRRGLRVVN